MIQGVARGSPQDGAPAAAEPTPLTGPQASTRGKPGVRRGRTAWGHSKEGTGPLSFSRAGYGPLRRGGGGRPASHGRCRRCLSRKPPGSARARPPAPRARASPGATRVALRHRSPESPRNRRALPYAPAAGGLSGSEPGARHPGMGDSDFWPTRPRSEGNPPREMGGRWDGCHSLDHFAESARMRPA